MWVEAENGLLTESEKEASTKRKLPDLFFLLAIIFGLILIFVEPPFAIPDENAHYINICRISNGGLFADVQDGQVGAYITTEELDFYYQYAGLYNGQENPLRYDYFEMKQLSARAASEEMTFLPTKLSTINPTAYLLPALFVGLIKLFAPINAYNAYLLSKFINLLFYAFVIRLALRKTGAFRNTMFLLALMPMAIFQGASTSYDAFLIPASFLLFAYVTKILRSDESYRISREDIVAICFCCAILFGVKIAYAPLVVVLLAISVKKFGDWKRWGYCVGAVALMGVIFYLLPLIITNRITKDVYTGLSPLQVEQQAYFMSHIWEFPAVVFHTVKHFGAYWIESFIGILGWLDAYFPKAFIILFSIVLGISALIDACSIRGFLLKARLLSLCGVAVFFIGTILTMYVRWNPELVGIIGGTLAYGGQGRYFIPVVLFAMIACANPLMEKIPERSRACIVDKHLSLVQITSIISLCLTVLLIMARYWF